MQIKRKPYLDNNVDENQINNILNAIHMHSIQYMPSKDYLNIVSTCKKWHNKLIHNDYLSMLKDIYLVSTPLFQRFLEKAKAIDRSDGRKHSEEYMEIGPTVAFDWVPQTQNEYEKKELKKAFEFKNNSLFDEISDENRRMLLDTVNEIDPSQLISSTQKDQLSIGELENLYNLMDKNYPNLQYLLALFNNQETEENKEWNNLIWSLIIIIIMVYWQVTLYQTIDNNF